MPALFVLVMALVMTLAGLTTAHANGTKTAPGQVKKSAPMTSPSPSPSVSPSPTAEPTAAPAPTVEPTASPSPTAEPAPTAPTTSTRPVGEVTVYVDQSYPAATDTNSGTASAPVRTIQRGVELADGLNAAGTPSRVLVAAGTYRESVRLQGQKTDAPTTLQGSPGTVLTGADRWNQWQAQSDGSLVHHWPHKWGAKALPASWTNYWNWDGNGYKRDVLLRSETVYSNGAPLRGVLRLAELTAGTFYVDESTERLHVRLPAGQTAGTSLLEVGTRTTPLSIQAKRHLTIRGLHVMRSRGALQDTALHVTHSEKVTFDDVTVGNTAYTGLGTAYNTGVVIRNSRIIDNGVLGLGQFRDVNVLVEDTTIARNNWRGWPAEHKGWDSVHKWMGIRDGVMRRVTSAHNFGHGFWLDTDNTRITLQDSSLRDNALNGVYLENNQGPIDLLGNRICNNAEAGIADAQSDQVTVKGNLIHGSTKYGVMFTGTYAGQSMRDWQSGLVFTNRSLFWTFDGNTVSGSGGAGWLWWHTDYNAPGAWSEVRKSIRVADNNTWIHTGRTSAFRLPQGAVPHSTFRADLQQAKPAHESASTWSSVAPTCSD